MFHLFVSLHAFFCSSISFVFLLGFQSLSLFPNDDWWAQFQLCVKFSEQQKNSTLTSLSQVQTTDTHCSPRLKLQFHHLSNLHICSQPEEMQQTCQFPHFVSDTCWVHWQCDYALHARVKRLKYLHYLTWASNPPLRNFTKGSIYLKCSFKRTHPKLL